MRNRAALAVTLAAIAFVTLTTSGCVQHTTRVIPTSPPSVAPVFKSDAEALAAAEKAYTAYLAVSDVIGGDGGKDPQRLAPLVTTKWLPTELTSYKAVALSGDRFVGSSSYNHFKLQSRDENTLRVSSVVVYSCLNISRSRTFNSENKDVTPPGRIQVLPLVVSFESAFNGSSRLILSGSEPWSGQNFCG
jgi:hypothetical protein